MTRDGAGGDGLGKLPATARQSRLIEAVERNGFLAVGEVAARLGVSTMTIRRDLLALERQGRLARTHGGALAARRPIDTEEPLFEQRRRRNAEGKARMAVAAAALIGPGQTVGLDVGTTTLMLAEALTGRDGLRIFTNSLRAAIALAPGRSPVYLLGGQLRDQELSVIGAATVAQVRDYYFDRVFIGVSGVTEDGFFDYSLEDSEVKRAFMAQAEEVVVLCDSTKFERRSLARVCALAAIDRLVTDQSPPAALAAALARAEVAVIVAD